MTFVAIGRGFSFTNPTPAIHTWRRKSRNLEAEYNVVLGFMQRCRYGRHQLPDPEANSIDVSE